LPISEVRLTKPEAGSVTPSKSQEVGPDSSEGAGTEKAADEWNTWVTPELTPGVEKPKVAEEPISTDQDEADVDENDPVTLAGVDNPNVETEQKELLDLPNDGVHPANLENEDAVEEFLLMFFELVDEPTDRQVHFLALALGVAPDELEDIVYAMISHSAESELDELRERKEDEELADDIPTEGSEDEEFELTEF
jgi:hypothetical protein